jgi:hypothetical protein
MDERNIKAEIRDASLHENSWRGRIIKKKCTIKVNRSHEKHGYHSKPFHNEVLLSPDQELSDEKFLF